GRGGAGAPVHVQRPPGGGAAALPPGRPGGPGPGPDAPPRGGAGSRLERRADPGGDRGGRAGGVHRAGERGRGGAGRRLLRSIPYASGGVITRRDMPVRFTEQPGGPPSSVWM